MKNLSFLIFLLLISAGISAQTRSLNRFINHQKVQDNALAVSVPGWLFDLAGMSKKLGNGKEDVEVKELLKLADKISRIRILIIPEGASQIDDQEIAKLKKGLTRERFEELVTVQSPEANVQLLIKEKRNKIKNVTAFIQAEDTMILMTISGNFKFSDFQDLKFWDQIKPEVKKAKEEKYILNKV